MTSNQRRRMGVWVGWACLFLVAAVFAALFTLPARPSAQSANTEAVAVPANLLADRIQDRATQDALAALNAANPAVSAVLERELVIAVLDGSSDERLAELVLQALFSQFHDQAFYIKRSSVEGYDLILQGFADGLTELSSHDSKWCRAPTVADFLSQNEGDLVPALLAQFPYGSRQYDWAVNWMTGVLTVAYKAQSEPARHGPPTAFDEAQLQEQGLALGTQNWSLGLQIATFANSEGVSYAKMQDAVRSIDVCRLGIAVNDVSIALPAAVRGRIWSDLMPEIMIGNTPYALYRIQDYFFIG